MKKRYHIENLDCANCAAKLEHALEQLDGVKAVSVQFVQQTLVLEADENRFDEVFAAVQAKTAEVEPEVEYSESDHTHGEHTHGEHAHGEHAHGAHCGCGHEHHEHGHEHHEHGHQHGHEHAHKHEHKHEHGQESAHGLEPEQRMTVIRLTAAVILLAAAWLLPVKGLWQIPIFAVPYLIAGCPVLLDALRNVRRLQFFDESLLMTAATIGAFAIGEYPEAAFVMIFFEIGELFEDIAVGRSRRSIAKLMDIRPDRAVVERGGGEETVSPEEVQPGEIIVIRPGDRIPLDGVIIEGSTSVYTAALTGESAPAEKEPGDSVLSGTVNRSGVIRVRTESRYEESTVARILELVESVSEKKSRAERFITRFSRYYTPIVVICALLVAVIPPLCFNGSWSGWIHSACVFLMVSCPCALVVSVPLSFFGGIGGASRSGILVKGANDLETLAGIDTVVFDKTGTLTHGEFAVDAIHPQECTADALLDIAAAAEQRSTHPVAESIMKAHGGHLDPNRVSAAEELAGHGIHAVIDGADYYVGNRKLMEQIGAPWRPCHHSGTVIHIARGSEYLGHIVINDRIKADAADAVAGLKALGIRKTVMLTGDLQSVAEQVGQAVGIDELHAQLLPADKVSAVEQLLKDGQKTAFVGDGINDAPVLMRADLGIAMGAMGSDAAMEAADVVLMDDSLPKLCTAVAIARKTMRIVRENIIGALAVKLLIMICSVLGSVSLWLAVFGDVGVLILAVLNALRAMHVSEPVQPAEKNPQEVSKAA